MNKVISNDFVISLPGYNYFGYFELTEALDLYTRIMLGQLFEMVPRNALFQMGPAKNNIVENCLRAVELLFRPGGGYYGIHSKDVDDNARTVYDFDKVIRHERAKLMGKENLPRPAYGVDSFEHYLADKDNVLPVFVDSELQNNGLGGDVKVSERTLRGLIVAMEAFVAIRTGNTDYVIDMFVNGTVLGKELPAQTVTQAKEYLASQKTFFTIPEENIASAQRYIEYLKGRLTD